MPSNSHRVTFGNFKLHLPIGLPKDLPANETVLQRMNVPNHTQSSANRRTEDLILFGKSFMKIKDRVGPRTDPCGTSDKTGPESEA